MFRSKTIIPECFGANHQAEKVQNASYIFWRVPEKFQDLPEFSGLPRHNAPAGGTTSPFSWGAVFGWFMGAPPLGGSPLLVDKVLGGPHGGG